MSKPLSLGHAPFVHPPRPLRRAAAAALRTLSALSSRMARRLRAAERAPARQPVLEFYAEAGAPEGSLYLDGKLVGYVHGISRL